jgi:hypothetical protein
VIGTDALEQALEAWYRPSTADRQVRLDDATALLEWGVFSKLQVAAITRLPRLTVLGLGEKHAKTGGTFNPETLPMLRDLRDRYRQGERPARLAALIYEQGTKQQMIHALTGIPMTTLFRWTRSE